MHRRDQAQVEIDRIIAAQDLLPGDTRSDGNCDSRLEPSALAPDRSGISLVGYPGEEHGCEKCWHDERRNEPAQTMGAAQCFWVRARWSVCRFWVGHDRI